jgi:hypothetical protein
MEDQSPGGARSKSRVGNIANGVCRAEVELSIAVNTIDFERGWVKEFEFEVIGRFLI